MILLNDLTHLRGTGKKIPRWTNMVNGLYQRAEMARARYLSTKTVPTKLSAFIRSLLADISDPQFFETDDMFELYDAFVSPIISNAEKRIDPLRGNSQSHNIFFAETHAVEHILPTSGIINGESISIYSSIEQWNKVQAVTLVTHDSNELYLRFYGGEITFTKIPATSAVITIDVGVLIWKYILYVRKHGGSPYKIDFDDFVASNIIAPLYTNLVDIWITRLFITNAIDDNILYPAVVNNTMLNDKYITKATAEQLVYLDLFKGGNISFDDYFVTCWLPGGISNYLKQHNRVTLPASQQYIGYELLRSDMLNQLILVLLDMLGAQRKTQKYYNELRVVARRLKNSNWESHVYSEEARSIIDVLLLQLDFMV